MFKVCGIIEISQIDFVDFSGIEKVKKFLAVVVMAALEAANVIISQAISSATQVLQETQNLLSNVNDLTQKYNYLLFASSNVTSAIKEGQEYGKFKQLSQVFFLKTSHWRCFLREPF